MLEKATVLFDYARETAQKKIEEFDSENNIMSRLTDEMAELKVLSRDNLGAKHSVYEKYSWMMDLLLWSKGEVGIGRFENFWETYKSE